MPPRTLNNAKSGIITSNISSASGIDIDAVTEIDIDAGTGSVSIDSTSGSITMGATLKDSQTLKLGKNGATEMIFTPHGTAGSEKISLTNTAGTDNAAIKLLSTAGGITIDGGNGTIQFADNGASLGTITSGGYSGTAAKTTVTDSNASTDFPVVFNDESNALLDDTGSFEYNPSTGTLTLKKLVLTEQAALSANTSNDRVLVWDADGGDAIKFETFANVCFLKGTKITLADKTQKKIEDLCVGEMILTYQVKGLSNLKKDQKHEIMNWSQDTMDGTFRQNRIKNIWVNPTERYLVINDKLRVTNLHIIHVKRDEEYKFLPAEKVQLGDKLFTDQGEYEPIQTIEQVNERTEVYNIEVKKNKTYFAENYLVHHFCETCSGLSGRI